MHRRPFRAHTQSDMAQEEPPCRAASRHPKTLLSYFPLTWNNHSPHTQLLLATIYIPALYYPRFAHQHAPLQYSLASCTGTMLFHVCQHSRAISRSGALPLRKVVPTILRSTELPHCPRCGCRCSAGAALSSCRFPHVVLWALPAPAHCCAERHCCSALRLSMQLRVHVSLTSCALPALVMHREAAWLLSCRLLRTFFLLLFSTLFLLLFPTWPQRN